MKAVCQALGLARSHIHALKHRPASWSDGRTGRTPATDAQLVIDIREQIAELPSYGYRRACALVNRAGRLSDRPRVNPKRVYRVMAGHGLLLPRVPRRHQSSRPHKGTVAVQASDLRWCSDGFEIKCDSGQTVTATFTKDCCDREVMAWRAWEGKGLPGEPVREMLIEAVESRPLRTRADSRGLCALPDRFTSHCRVYGARAAIDPLRVSRTNSKLQLKRYAPWRSLSGGGYGTCSSTQ